MYIKVFNELIDRGCERWCGGALWWCVACVLYSLQKYLVLFERAESQSMRVVVRTYLKQYVCVCEAMSEFVFFFLKCCYLVLWYYKSKVRAFALRRDIHKYVQYCLLWFKLSQRMNTISFVAHTHITYTTRRHSFYVLSAFLVSIKFISLFMYIKSYINLFWYRKGNRRRYVWHISHVFLMCGRPRAHCHFCVCVCVCVRVLFNPRVLP